jgi:hypothetical protein
MLRPSKWVMPVVLLGLLSCCVLADPPVPPKGAPAGIPSQQTGPMTDEALLQMLRGLGYEPKISTLNNGGKMYEISVSRGGLTYSFNLSLSSDKTVIWIQVALARIPVENKVQSEAPLKILKLNDSSTGKAKFTIKKSGYLYLAMPLDNEGVTPARLRTAIEGLAGYAKNTAAYWKTSAWTVEGKEAIAFKDKVEALYGKVRDAYREFTRELNPALEGRPVDLDRLKQAHAKLMQTIREVRESMKGLDVPNTPAARELLDVHQPRW